MTTITATITDLDEYSPRSADADLATVSGRVRLGEAMAERLGRGFSAPARVHLGVLWGDSQDTADSVLVGRRMVAVGRTHTYPTRQLEVHRPSSLPNSVQWHLITRAR